MEKTEESVGIRVYTATPPQKPSPPPPSRPPKPVSVSSLPTLPVGSAAGGGKGRKRRMVAQGVQKTVSKTSMLVNFLPTGTLLMFEMVLPSIYRDGDCNGINTLMIHLLLLLCAMSCFFFHFTDSFKAADGKIYYGFVTPRGLAVFMKPPPPDFGSESHWMFVSRKRERDGPSYGELSINGRNCLQCFVSCFSDHSIGVGCMSD